GVWGNDVPAFPLDGFQEDGSHLLGWQRALEELFLNESGAPARVFFLLPLSTSYSAVEIWVGHVCHPRHQRREAATLLWLRCRKRERSHGAPMKCAIERDYILPFRVIAGELEGTFNGLGTRVSVVELVRSAHGSDRAQALGQLRHLLIIEIGAGHMDEFRRLLLDGGNDFRMRMPGRDDGDSRGEIQEFVAFHIFND